MLLVFAGCSTPSSTAANTDSNGTRIIGQVTAIDGNNITLALFSMPSGGNGQQSGGNGSARPSGQRQYTQGSYPPSASGSQQPYPQGSGNTGGFRGGMTLSGESKTITITDSTAITTGGTGQNSSAAKASLTDITVGSYLSVTLSGDTVTAVTIMNFGNRNGNAQASPSPSESPSVSVSPSPVSSPLPTSTPTPSVGIRATF